MCIWIFSIVTVYKLEVSKAHCFRLQVKYSPEDGSSVLSKRRFLILRRWKKSKYTSGILRNCFLQSDINSPLSMTEILVMCTKKTNDPRCNDNYTDASSHDSVDLSYNFLSRNMHASPSPSIPVQENGWVLVATTHSYTRFNTKHSDTN
jgi:hypothetical protein